MQSPELFQVKLYIGSPTSRSNRKVEFGLFMIFNVYESFMNSFYW